VVCVCVRVLAAFIGVINYGDDDNDGLALTSTFLARPRAKTLASLSMPKFCLSVGVYGLVFNCTDVILA